MRITRIVMPFALAALLATLLPGLTGDAAAQTLLAWKFQAGDAYNLQVQQQTSSTATAVNKAVKTTIEMTLESTWKVESVAEGTAKIRQAVRRVQVRVQAADSPLITFDSSAPGQPSGAARDLASAVSPLVDPESSILLTMNARGEILSAELSPKLAQWWSTEQKDAANESLDALLKQPLVNLPENPVMNGNQWEANRELFTPAGKFAQKIEYTYDGRLEPPATADKISYTATISPSVPNATRIKAQSQTGTVAFDSSAGRFVSGEQVHKLTTESTYRGATIEVAIETVIKRTMSRQ